MKIEIRGRLPRFDEIDGVPEQFLLPAEECEQLRWEEPGRDEGPKRRTVRDTRIRREELGCGRVRHEELGRGRVRREDTSIYGERRFNGQEEADRRIRAILNTVYNFFTAHQNPRTLEDFTAISRAMGEYGRDNPDPLLIGLLKECFLELERQYAAAQGLSGDTGGADGGHGESGEDGGLGE